ncbi:MFS transporter [Streptomyces tagetis]|uniref:MFS transporter n=1 Tax=Streptomyces tagetis TaxID=2820809 RepID=A0A941B181_9ACTN|nr:MFS transporter [Streptomyces sp. RG38]MBQ0825822.1 MFS transporter [Streptomyces sp. RG38]
MNSSPRARGDDASRRAAAASLIGTTVEWYDFFIYATAAALVFPAVFFPDDMDPLLATVVSFGTTSFGYVGRPIGALLFGHFGDRVGRKATLVVTILVMGVATTGIGLLPGYATVGAAAPVLLVLLRLVQGIAVGGEWGGAALMAVEHAPAGRRSFYGAFTQVGSSIGALLSSLMFVAAGSVGGPLSGGSWRYPFLFSAALVVIGLLIRSTVDESPAFQEMRRDDEISSAPLVEALRRHRGTILLAAGAMVVATGGYYVTSSFWLVHATAAGGMDEGRALNLLSVAAAFEIACTLAAGRVADRLGTSRVVVVGLASAAVVAPLWFLAARSDVLVLVVLAAALMAVPTGAHYGPMARLLVDLFPRRVRYSGVSMACQLAALTSGALTPVIVPVLYAAGGERPYLALLFLAALCALSLWCVLALRRRAGAPDADPAGGTSAAAPASGPVPGTGTASRTR